jgi:hypothetical protein
MMDYFILDQERKPFSFLYYYNLEFVPVERIESSEMTNSSKALLISNSIKELRVLIENALLRYFQPRITKLDIQILNMTTSSLNVTWPPRSAISVRLMIEADVEIIIVEFRRALQAIAINNYQCASVKETFVYCGLFTNKMSKLYRLGKYWIDVESIKSMNGVQTGINFYHSISVLSLSLFLI